MAEIVQCVRGLLVVSIKIYSGVPIINLIVSFLISVPLKLVVSKRFNLCSAGAFEAIVKDKGVDALIDPLAGIESIKMLPPFTVAKELSEVKLTKRLLAVNNPLFLNDGWN